MRVTAGGRSFELSLPAAAREAFLDGSWDATGLLLEDYDEVRARRGAPAVRHRRPGRRADV